MLQAATCRILCLRFKHQPSERFATAASAAFAAVAKQFLKSKCYRCICRCDTQTHTTTHDSPDREVVMFSTKQLYPPPPSDHRMLEKHELLKFIKFRDAAASRISTNVADVCPLPSRPSQPCEKETHREQLRTNKFSQGPPAPNRGYREGPAMR